MLDFIVKNWYMIIVGVIVLAAIVVGIVKWFQQPTDKKIKNLKEWLRFAVTAAEKEYGSGTGPVKLRAVYDACIAKFPWVAVFISFETFSGWVDEALKWMNKQLEDNPAISAMVK